MLPASGEAARSCVFIANVPVAASVIAPAFVLWHTQRPQTRIISPTFTVAPSLSLTCSKYVNTLSVAEAKLGGTLSVCFYFFFSIPNWWLLQTQKGPCTFTFWFEMGEKTDHIVSSSTTTRALAEW